MAVFLAVLSCPITAAQAATCTGANYAPLYAFGTGATGAKTVTLVGGVVGSQTVVTGVAMYADTAAVTYANTGTFSIFDSTNNLALLTTKWAGGSWVQSFDPGIGFGFDGIAVSGKAANFGAATSVSVAIWGYTTSQTGCDVTTIAPSAKASPAASPVPLAVREDTASGGIYDLHVSVLVGLALLVFFTAATFVRRLRR